MDAKVIYQKIQEQYGAAATGNNVGGQHERKVAKAFGYSEEELANIPNEANLGLSCGNPTALAKLKEGETVIDLGCGAGFDVFLAAKKVGSSGKAIGVDMTKEMLDKANRNKENAKAENVSFVESPITKIELPDGIADCIISNCVVNLVPEDEKQLVFNETFRLLKSGGRVAISDILVKKELPDRLKNSMALYVGCIAGASQVQDYEKYLRKAGFNDIMIVDAKGDLNVYSASNDEKEQKVACCSSSNTKSSCNGSASAKQNGPTSGLSEFKDVDFNEWAGSFQVYAVKP